MDYNIIGAYLEPDFFGVLTSRLLTAIIPVVILIILFTIAVRLASKSGKVRQKAEKLIAENEAANTARAREIEDEHFFKPELDKLPIRTFTAEEMSLPHPVYLWQNKVVQGASKKMLRFGSEQSNVELKRRYGLANLEFVARYEENFTNFCHGLRHWAQVLLLEGNEADAQMVLEFAVHAGSEISLTYTMLADIYKNQNDVQKLKELTSKSEKNLRR
ncbi:MAG: hypothetical protein FWB74_08880 [Defluviitaleaceae bacterium]|nr:hypothetical protein [Defluviitaleaceae bacterium]